MVSYLLIAFSLITAGDSVRKDTFMLLSVPSVTEFPQLEKIKTIKPVEWTSSSCSKELTGDQRWINAGIALADISYSVQYYRPQTYFRCLKTYISAITPLLSENDTSTYSYLRTIPTVIRNADSALANLVSHEFETIENNPQSLVQDYYFNLGKWLGCMKHLTRYFKPDIKFQRRLGVFFAEQQYVLQNLLEMHRRYCKDNAQALWIQNDLLSLEIELQKIPKRQSEVVVENKNQTTTISGGPEFLVTSSADLQHIVGLIGSIFQKMCE